MRAQYMFFKMYFVPDSTLLFSIYIHLFQNEFCPRSCCIFTLSVCESNGVDDQTSWSLLNVVAGIMYYV